MACVTAFRHVPEPIIGMMSGIKDRRFNVLEESLDWLETTGLLVERFDPAVTPEEVAKRPAARQLLLKDESCLPLILVDEVVALKGAYPTRAQLAHAVGRARTEGRQAGRPAA